MSNTADRVIDTYPGLREAGGDKASWKEGCAECSEQAEGRVM